MPRSNTQSDDDDTDDAFSDSDQPSTSGSSRVPLRRKLRYFGDYTEEDLYRPERAITMWELAKKRIDVKSKQVKSLRVENYRLRKKVEKLENLVSRLTNQSKVSKECEISSNKNPTTSPEKEESEPTCNIEKSSSPETSNEKTSKNQTYRCPHCSKFFEKVRNFHRHISLLKSPVYCKVCSKTFYATEHFIQHVPVHCPRAYLYCVKCFKYFTSKWSLNLHGRECIQRRKEIEAQHMKEKATLMKKFEEWTKQRLKEAKIKEERERAKVAEARNKENARREMENNMEFMNYYEEHRKSMQKRRHLEESGEETEKEESDSENVRDKFQEWLEKCVNMAKQSQSSCEEISSEEEPVEEEIVEKESKKKVETIEEIMEREDKEMSGVIKKEDTEDIGEAENDYEEWVKKLLDKGEAKEEGGRKNGCERKFVEKIKEECEEEKVNEEFEEIMKVEEIVEQVVKDEVIQEECVEEEGGKVFKVELVKKEEKVLQEGYEESNRDELQKVNSSSEEKIMEERIETEKRVLHDRKEIALETKRFKKHKMELEFMETASEEETYEIKKKKEGEETHVQRFLSKGKHKRNKLNKGIGEPKGYQDEKFLISMEAEMYEEEYDEEEDMEEERKQSEKIMRIYQEWAEEKIEAEEQGINEKEILEEDEEAVKYKGCEGVSVHCVEGRKVDKIMNRTRNKRKRQVAEEKSDEAQGSLCEGIIEIKRSEVEPGGSREEGNTEERINRMQREKILSKYEEWTKGRVKGAQQKGRNGEVAGDVDKGEEHPPCEETIEISSEAESCESSEEENVEEIKRRKIRQKVVWKYEESLKKRLKDEEIHEMSLKKRNREERKQSSSDGLIKEKNKKSKRKEKTVANKRKYEVTTEKLIKETEKLRRDEEYLEENSSTETDKLHENELWECSVEESNDEIEGEKKDSTHTRECEELLKQLMEKTQELGKNQEFQEENSSIEAVKGPENELCECVVEIPGRKKHETAVQEYEEWFRKRIKNARIQETKLQARNSKVTSEEILEEDNLSVGGDVMEIESDQEVLFKQENEEQVEEKEESGRLHIMVQKHEVWIDEQNVGN